MSQVIRFHMADDARDLAPSKAHPDDAAFDLRTRIAASVPPGGIVLMPTGLFLELPVGYEAQVRPRSGLALKHGLTVLNSPGTIDAGYRGEVGVILINCGTETQNIQRGERIAQLVIQSLPAVTLQESAQLNDSARGDGGFGSTGRN
jgi:dUTP pyrophosphatase